MSDTLIHVEGLYKKFSQNLKRSMLYGTGDTLRSMVGIRNKQDRLRKSEFWALQDINFELKRGEVLGLVGRNGCGKTTLLRLLTGIFPPDKGRITLKGRVGALIAVGAGFHPHMSGRENIFLNGTILGLTRQEIKNRFEEIIEFAEIGEFIDAPVATYSSGMKVRLGFSIAVHIDPDILFVDEVLAVGDAAFRAKCLNKILDLINKAAVIFVSHQMGYIERVCDNLLVLDGGKIIYLDNNISHGIDLYNSTIPMMKRKVYGNERVEICDVNIFNSRNEEIIFGRKSINYAEYIKINFSVVSKDTISNFVTSIVFMGIDLSPWGQFYSDNFLEELEPNKKYQFETGIESLQLRGGDYYICIIIFDNRKFKTIVRYDRVAKITINGNKSGFPHRVNGTCQIINN